MDSQSLTILDLTFRDLGFGLDLDFGQGLLVYLKSSIFRNSRRRKGLFLTYLCTFFILLFHSTYCLIFSLTGVLSIVNCAVRSWIWSFNISLELYIGILWHTRVNILQHMLAFKHWLFGFGQLCMWKSRHYFKVLVCCFYHFDFEWKIMMSSLLMSLEETLLW